MYTKLKKKLNSVLIALTVLSLVVSAYYYIKYKETSRIVSNPNIAGEAERDQLVKTVSKLINLPEGEIPTLATVSEVDKLRDQPFFKNALNGDKVLIYGTSKKAIMYRPATNKIIEIAPIAINESSAESTPNQNPQVAGLSSSLPQSSPEDQNPVQQSLSLLIVSSASSSPEKATQLRQTLGQNFNQLTRFDSAISANNYPQNIVVIRNDRASDIGKQITQDTRALLQDSLPENEIGLDTSADIVLILGEQ